LIQSCPFLTIKSHSCHHGSSPPIPSLLYHLQILKSILLHYIILSCSMPPYLIISLSCCIPFFPYSLVLSHSIITILSVPYYPLRTVIAQSVYWQAMGWMLGF
jgi:hypothetical protein